MSARPIPHPNDRAAQDPSTTDPQELLILLDGAMRRVWKMDSTLGLHLLCAYISLEEALRPGSIAAGEVPKLVGEARELLKKERRK